MGLFAEIAHMGPRQTEQLTVEEFEALADYVEKRAKGK